MFGQIFCFSKNNAKTKQSKRNSNLELLRIIAMLMIVAHHFGIYAVGYSTGSTLTDYYHAVFYSFGKVGVVLFMMISAYFLCDKPVKRSRAISVWLKTFVFSASIAVIVKLFFAESAANGGSLLFNFLPISTCRYWFVTAYVFVLIISPLLNMIIDKLDKKRLRHFLLFFILMWGVIYTFTEIQALFSGFLELTFIYMLTAYLKRYYKLKSKRYYQFAVLFLLLCHLFSVALGTFLPEVLQVRLHINGPLHFAYALYPVVLFLSIEIFMLFLTLKPKYNQKVNFISSLTFDVYLVHEHPYMRYLIWNTIFVAHPAWSLVAKIPYSIVVVTAVYTLSSLIGLVYKCTIFRLIEKTRLVDKIEKYTDKALVIVDRRIDDEEVN